jgi:hypothetical protein
MVGNIGQRGKAEDGTTTGIIAQECSFVIGKDGL